MSEKKSATIIVTTYNVQQTIRQTMDCIVASRVDFDFDIVVVDDQSTDNTVSILREYSINLIELEKNRGPAHARNIAIQAASGEFLIFIDSDVVFPDDLLQRMMDKINEDPKIGGVGSVSDPEPLNPNFFSRYFAMQEYYLITSCASVNRNLGICTRCGILRRKLFEEFGGFDERHRKPSIEDYQFSLRIRSSYDTYWDPDFVNQHHFPESFWQIMKRLHRNTREMIQVMSDLEVKDTGPYVNDTRSRIFIGFSGLLLLLVPFSLFFLIPSFVFMVGAIWIKRELLTLFISRHGWIFAIKGWLIYVAICFPLLTGTFEGLIKARQRTASGESQ